MKKAFFPVYLFLLCIILPGCVEHAERDYAIKDFRADLRPLLKGIVGRGYIDDDSLSKRLHIAINDEELTKLVWSEHPLLRATAIIEKLSRDSLADNLFLEQHLDDTAIIWKDMGEWGQTFTTVADIMLDNAEWASDSMKMIIARKVIVRHNYLSAAFRVLPTMEPEPGLYPAIRSMAIRKRYFHEQEEAIFKLAAYRKKEDVTLVQKLLNENISELNVTSFRLMESYPDTCYLSVLEKFFMHAFVRRVCRDFHDFSEKIALDCIASYKVPRTAFLLSRLWEMTPIDCSSSWSGMKDYLLDAIWENQCDSYSQLLKATAAAKRKRDQSTIIFDSPAQRPTEIKRIRWEW